MEVAGREIIIYAILISARAQQKQIDRSLPYSLNDDTHTQSRSMKYCFIPIWTIVDEHNAQYVCVDSII